MERYENCGASEGEIEGGIFFLLESFVLKKRECEWEEEEGAPGREY
jgi:hypothetical protein